MRFPNILTLVLLTASQLAGQNLAKLGPLPEVEPLNEGELEESIKRGVD